MKSKGAISRVRICEMGYWALLENPARRAARAAWLGLVAFFALLLPQGAWAGESFLAPELAFRSDAAAADSRTLELRFDVAPGYYLYRQQFKFEASSAQLGAARIPTGEKVFDETFGKTLETHRGRVRIALPVEGAGDAFRLAVTYQGCSDKGLCYPPMQMRADVALDSPNGAISRVRVLAGREVPLPDPGPLDAASGGADRVESALQSGRLSLVLAAFFAAGLLLSLTPCVLPMLPILSSIIVGQGGPVTRGRGLALAASYSLGMAVVYTAFGVAAGLVGEGLTATLQNRWVLGGFAALLVVLALSALDVVHFAVPRRLVEMLGSASGRLPGGQLGGVFSMGGLSALIVSPCVAAPLAGALVYLSQTRDVVLGGAALFAMAWGMSVPLLAVGASAGALLPKAGRWMEDVKRLFALLLIGMAIWTLRPVLPMSVALGLWGVLTLGAAALALVSAFKVVDARGRGLQAAAAAILVAAGVIQLAGAASGATDPLEALQRIAGADSSADSPALVFRPVRSSADLDAAIAAAGKPVVLDFYADWCVSCKEMEQRTYRVPAVRERLEKAVLLKADVTANTAADRQLLRRFGLFGPPGTLFFSAGGNEIGGTRVIGYQDSQRFEQTLGAAGL